MDTILPWILGAGGGAIGGNLIGLFGRLRRLTPLFKTILGALGGVAAVKLGALTKLLPSMGEAQTAGVGALAGALVTFLLGGLMVRRRY